jgi:hypothetical protein
MYKIEKKFYGYKLTFDGFIQLNEMKSWVEDVKKGLVGAPNEFGVFVDMRTLKPLDTETQEFMKTGQVLFKQMGMVRSVVIVEAPITKMQFQRIAKETGIYAWERYLDTQTNSDWENVGLDWISKGIDPDKK